MLKQKTNESKNGQHKDAPFVRITYISLHILGQHNENNLLSRLFFFTVTIIFLFQHILYWLKIDFISDIVSHARYHCNYFSLTQVFCCDWILVLSNKFNSFTVFCFHCRFTRIGSAFFGKLTLSLVFVFLPTNWKSSSGRFVFCLRQNKKHK